MDRVERQQLRAITDDVAGWADEANSVLAHRAKVDISIDAAPPGVSFVYPCRFGSGVLAARADGAPVPASEKDVPVPAGTSTITVTYASP